MFEQHILSAGDARRIPVSTAISLGAHGLIVALVVAIAGVKARQAVEKEVQVAFVANRTATTSAPPPPPPARRRRTTPKRTKVEIPKRAEMPKPVEIPRVIPPPEEIEEPDDDGEEGGVEGGVKGGVVGGVVGGVLGGKLEGTVGTGGPPPPPPPAARPKAKNVPAFVVQRTAIRQPSPRLSEVFKQANRGKAGILGMYRVCVDTDGHVYEVVVVKSVPGADDSIVEGLKDYWLFQPQQVPVCFLYNMPITIQ